MGRLLSLAFVGAAALANGTGKATQARNTNSGAPTGTVTGVAYDSLNLRPLAHAHIHVKGLAQEAFADSSGRFRIDSVPAGRQVIWADHPTLDSLGLFALQVPVTVIAGNDATAALSVPSFATMWSRLCESALPAGGAPQGVIVGTIKSLLGGALDSGTYAEFTWAGTGGARMLGRGHADANGSYTACGIPRDAPVTLRAISRDRATLPTVIQLGNARIVRRDLTLASQLELSVDEAARDTMAAAMAAEPGGAVVRGAVHDTAGRGVEDARVRIDGTTLDTRTSAGGAFLLKDAPSGTRRLAIEAIGYAPAAAIVDLYPADTIRADAVIERRNQLRPVKITAREVNTRFADFEQRRRMGMGVFVDSAAIQRSIRIYHVLSAPGVSVSGNTRGWVARNTFRRGAVMPLYLDGHRSNSEEIDAYRPQIIAIEIYAHAADVPMHIIQSGMLNDRGDAGAMLFWTRSSLRP